MDEMGSGIVAKAFGIVVVFAVGILALLLFPSIRTTLATYNFTAMFPIMGAWKTLLPYMLLGGAVLVGLVVLTHKKEK